MLIGNYAKVIACSLAFSLPGRGDLVANVANGPVVPPRAVGLGDEPAFSLSNLQKRLNRSQQDFKVANYVAKQLEIKYPISPEVGRATIAMMRLNDAAIEKGPEWAAANSKTIIEAAYKEYDRPTEDWLEMPLQVSKTTSTVIGHLADR